MGDNLDQMIDSFLVGRSEYDLHTENIDMEKEYIRWLILNYLKADYTKQDIEALYFDKYFSGENVELFLRNFALTHSDSLDYFHIQFKDDINMVDTIVPSDMLFKDKSIFHSMDIHNFDGKSFRVEPVSRFFHAYMNDAVDNALQYSSTYTKSYIVEDLYNFFDSISDSCKQQPLNKAVAVSWENDNGDRSFVVDQDIQSAFKTIVLRIKPEAIMDIDKISEREAKKYAEKYYETRQAQTKNLSR